MNNQPFTFKNRILRDPDEMTVAAKHHSAWRHFIAAVETVESASQDEAFEALALLFRLARRRSSDIIADVESLRAKSLTELEAIARDVCAFVEEHPDGGRTGQAFVAAVLDLVYGAASVLLGQVNDPDAGRSGDVHVEDGQAVWLWTEVKQRVVSNGDVLDFSAQVAADGGGRALYCALANERYPENLSPTRIRQASEAIGVALDFFVSPQALLQHFLRVAPGSPTQRIERLLQRLSHRLTEAEGSPATLADFGELVRRLA